ncbi:MAG: DUF4230 domain-containing protein [Bacteroidota bacterium]
MPDQGTSAQVIGMHFISVPGGVVPTEDIPEIAPAEVKYVPRPAADSTGSAPSVLPSVAITPADFPWTLGADLALILLAEREIGTDGVSIVQKSGHHLPEVLQSSRLLPYATSGNNRINLLQAPVGWWIQNLPPAQIRSQLAHKRMQYTSPTASRPEQAVLLASRLPQPGEKHHALLVAYPHTTAEDSADGKLEWPILFQWEYTAGEDAAYRLAGPAINGLPKSLQTALAPLTDKLFFSQKTFSEQVASAGATAAQTTTLLRTAQVERPAWEFFIESEKVDLAFVPVLPPRIVPQALWTGAKPELGNPRRFLPGLPQVCLNQGPFYPDPAPFHAPTLPALEPNELIFDTGTIPDISHSVAWQLGQTLAKNERNFTRALMQWRWQRPDTPNQAKPAPPQVTQFLDDLAHFKGIPVEALIPLTELLPRGSARLFVVDLPWLACLLDGAYSVGRMTEQDLKQDALYRPYPILPPALTGFVLQSEALSLWESVPVEAFDQKGRALAPYLVRKLNSNTLLAIFRGYLAAAAILPAATLAYQFLPTDLIRPDPNLQITLRDPAGGAFLSPQIDLPIVLNSAETPLSWSVEEIGTAIARHLQRPLTAGILGLELMQENPDLIKLARDASGNPQVSLVPRPSPVLVADDLADIGQLLNQVPPNGTAPPFLVEAADPLIPPPQAQSPPVAPPPVTPPNQPPADNPSGKGGHDPANGGSGGASSKSGGGDHSGKPPPPNDPPPIPHPVPQGPSWWQKLGDYLRAHPRTIALLVLLLVFLSAGGLHLVNSIRARFRPDPLVTHFQGLQSMEELRLVEQEYREVIPITDKDGRLEFLIQAPARIYGAMDMTRLQFEKQENGYRVHLPPPIISAPYIDLHDIQTLDIRSRKISLFLAGGGKKFDRVYAEFKRAIKATEQGLRESARTNGIEADVRREARHYFLNLGRTFGVNITLEDRDTDPINRIEDRIRGLFDPTQPDSTRPANQAPPAEDEARRRERRRETRERRPQ